MLYRHEARFRAFYQVKNVASMAKRRVRPSDIKAYADERPTEAANLRKMQTVGNVTGMALLYQFFRHCHHLCYLHRILLTIYDHRMCCPHLKLQAHLLAWSEVAPCPGVGVQSTLRCSRLAVYWER